MEYKDAYEQYRNALVEIVDKLRSAASSQGTLAQNERDVFSSIENEFKSMMDELENAEKIVRDQYRSVWEDCTKEDGIRAPMEQRPLSTDLDWKSAVQKQQQTAGEIRNWFAEKAEKATLERKRRLEEEERRRKAQENAVEEEARRRAQEAERKAEKDALELIERMKRQYR